MATLVWPISGVNPVVLLKVTELSEALLAEGAGVGFHSGVDADMLGKVARVGK